MTVYSVFLHLPTLHNKREGGGGEENKRISLVFANFTLLGKHHSYCIHRHVQTCYHMHCVFNSAQQPCDSCKGVSNTQIVA